MARLTPSPMPWEMLNIIFNAAGRQVGVEHIPGGSTTNIAAIYNLMERVVGVLGWQSHYSNPILLRLRYRVA